MHVARNSAQFNSPFRDGGKLLTFKNLRFCRPDIENARSPLQRELLPNLENSICQILKIGYLACQTLKN